MLDPRVKVYIGGTWRPDFPDTNFQAEPPTSGKDPTSLTLALSDSDIHAGDAITLTATLKTNGSALASKSVAFQEKVGTAAWTTVDTETTNGSGVATISPTLTPATGRQYRAVFTTDTSYVGSTSSVKTVIVRTLQEVTERFYSTWSQAYAVDNSQLSTTDIRQNIFTSGSNVDRRKSLIGFNDSSIRDFLAGFVDEVQIKFSMKGDPDQGISGAFTNQLGLVGYHNQTSKPTTWNSGHVTTGKGSVVVESGVRNSIILSAADISDWEAGTYKGVAIGPATSDSKIYVIYALGNVTGGDDNSEPWIEFTITKWVAA